MKNFLIESASSLKAAVGIICYNIGTGFVAWMDMIPDSVANLNTLLAATLALVLIVMHVRRMMADKRAEKEQTQLVGLQEEKLKLEIEQLKALGRRRGDGLGVRVDVEKDKD